MNERAKIGSTLILGIIIGYVISPTKTIKVPGKNLQTNNKFEILKKDLSKCKNEIKIIRKSANKPMECRNTKVQYIPRKSTESENTYQEKKVQNDLRKYKPIKSEEIIFKELPFEGNEVAHQKIKDYRYKDPGSAYVKAKLFKEMGEELVYLNGNYTGQVVYTETERRGDYLAVYLDIDYTNVQGKASGKFEIKLYDGDKLMSSNGGDGNNHAIKTFKNSNDIVIIINPNTFMQILNTKNKDVLLGNVYKDYEFIGVAQLVKKYDN